MLTGCDTTGVEGDNPEGEPFAKRIVALSPHLTELVYSAGAGDRLVGVVEYSDFPPSARDLPRIGDSFRLDYEALAGLEPDLILAWRSGTPTDVQDRLRDMGFRVVAMDARTLDEIAVQLVEIGRLAGTSDSASASAEQYRRRLQALRDRNRGAAIVDVFYQVSAQPLFTIGARHVINEVIETCGGRNVFSELDDLSPAVSLEAVIVAAPDVIVAGHDSLRADGRTELIEQWAEWESIPAVSEGHLFVVDANRMHRATLRIVDAIQSLCTQLEQARATPG